MEDSNEYKKRITKLEGSKYLNDKQLDVIEEKQKTIENKMNVNSEICEEVKKKLHIYVCRVV